MTQEEKQLLLQDLCARLPYGVKVQCYRYSRPVTVLYAGNINEVKFAETGGIEHIEAIKPYLRPMSSMTEEEEKVFNDFLDFQAEYVSDADLDNKTDMFDWLNAHHFDFRNLIERGLAIDCTNLNIY